MHALEAQQLTIVVQKEGFRTSPRRGSDKLQAPPEPQAEHSWTNSFAPQGPAQRHSGACRWWETRGAEPCVWVLPLSKERILLGAPTKRDGN